ncbi:MAG: hypothetical protein R3F20_00170 [Planctomycetota bacterium]
MAKRRWWLVFGALILAIAVSVGALAVQGRRTERRLDGLRAELGDLVGSLPRSPAASTADEALVAALIADRIADRETSRRAGDVARAEHLVSLTLSPPIDGAPPSPTPNDGSATLALIDAVRRLTEEAKRAASEGRPQDAVRFLLAARRSPPPGPPCPRAPSAS